jgi:dihydrolipoamide dehydrogenase
MQHFDLLVIGAGPGGIAAAMHAAGKGLRTAIIEAGETGGVCVNAGCMPTKFLLSKAKDGVDAAALFAEKETLISRLRSSADAMLLKNGVTVIRGHAAFVDERTVRAGEATVMAEDIIIATGSLPRLFPWLPQDKTVTPEAFLRRPFDAASYAIVGGGVIGVEFAFLLAALGKQVTLFEKEARILPLCDADLVKKIERNLKKKGVTVSVSTEVSANVLEPFDAVICAVGRRPNTEGLALARAGIETDDGWIRTDVFLRTEVPHIFACGDVRGEYLYAYTAEHEGRAAVETILGNRTRYTKETIATCVFSKPAYASVGMTQEQASACGMTYRVAKKDLISLSSSHLYGDTDGVVKMLVDAAGRIIGVQIFSNQAHELIATAALAIARRMTARDLANELFVHPSISEALTKTAEMLCE